MINRIILRFAYLALVPGLLLQPALAQGNSQGHGHGHGRGHGKHQQDSASVQIVFTRGDREVIRDYFHDNYSNLPPGLAKRGGNLPPGLQKHLERDGTLPPGLQKRLTPFPEELERRLPPLPGPYARVVLGVDVLIVNRTTQRIMDIIHDVVRP